MYSIAVAVANGILIAFLCSTQMNSVLWSTIFGILAVLATQIIIALIVRKKMSAVNTELQMVIADGQQKVSRKVNQFQTKPVGNLKTMQKLIEKEQHESLRDALSVVDKMERFKNWSPLLQRQINTIRMQFYYQLKEFDKADELMPKCLFMEHTAVAMRMARMYHNKKEKELASFFKRKIKKYNTENAVLLYSLYAWILVKWDKVDEAIKLLVKGKEATGDELLKKNWELLANGKVKQFSNAQLGDAWYSLYLEEMKTPKQKRQRGKHAFR